MKKILAAIAVFTLGSFHSLAHEGHNKTPGAISAPHGGQVKGTDSLYLELVSDKDGFKLYPLTHEMKVVPAKEISLEAKVKFPKKSGSENIKLMSSADFFEGKVNAEGAYRYTVEIKMTYQGKKDHLTFNVEPQ